jgi:hypothetical protein
MSYTDGPVPEHAGPGTSSRRIDLHAVALPISDQLIVIAPNGSVAALDAAGRRLWEALETGCTVDDLVAACVGEGDLREEAARANIARALASWRRLGLIDAADLTTPKAEPLPVARSVAARPVGRAPELDAVYLPGDRAVRVRCDDPVVAGVIEAACRSCRVGDAGGTLAIVDVIEQDGWLAVRSDRGELTRADDVTRNRALARHRCLTAMLEASRQGRRWLGILHASSVGAAGRCVVFPGPKGSGKSTLTAALTAAGLEFVTDDYAPLEQATWRIWPVPYAPGIKQGSWRGLQLLYPDLDERPVHKLAGLQVRYLDLDAQRKAPLNQGLPVAALVFPRYRAGSGLEQRRLTAVEALTGLCHARSLLDRQPDVFAETLRWIAAVPAYQLTYGDLDPAIEWVQALLSAA